MGTRILIWHQKDDINDNSRIGPTYYMEADYTPVAVRIYSEVAPTHELKVDIFDDGVSIFSNRTLLDINATTGVDQSGSAVTAVTLPANTNSEENAEDFTESPRIEEGSWIHCNLVNAGGGRNITVQLELYTGSEGLQEEE